MQPYSELANWDGSLSAPVPSDSAPDIFPDVSAMAVDSLSAPSLSDPTLPDKVRLFLGPCRFRHPSHFFLKGLIAPPQRAPTRPIAITPDV
jgi:hypothetical protein